MVMWYECAVCPDDIGNSCLMECGKCGAGNCLRRYSENQTCSSYRMADGNI